MCCPLTNKSSDSKPIQLSAHKAAREPWTAQRKEDVKNYVISFLQIAVIGVSIAGFAGALSTSNLAIISTALLAPQFLFTAYDLTKASINKDWVSICSRIMEFVFISGVIAISAYSMVDPTLIGINGICAINTVAAVGFLLKKYHECS